MSDVVITSRAPALRVQALLDPDAPPKLVLAPGWQENARPRKVGFPEWTGRGAPRLALGILLEGWADDADQEPAVRTLEKLTEPSPQSAGQPPVVRVSGTGVPCSPQAEWVLEGIEFGDVVARRADGRRVRQSVALTLMQYSEPEIAFADSASARAAQAATKAARTITARAGDTMAKIAARELGKASRWQEIRALNPALKDPSREIKAGTKVKVPSS